ncbi:hypothetical protein H0910_07520 [Providencia alcalifaciens]|uniref:tail fiber/spike domain-containing protein n=1 Tax=Providencia alcalifaciens TaxID=126385 RepID=UPI0015EBA6B1|nr:hypothetical protein [Providencia alcalifaciens]QLQ98878.1 hypothetical protein H0910_07520 [Providencia alcalifaciens]
MREVKPTQKPVPSSDIKDLFFNSGLLDIWATSLERKYIDRFGNCHLTAAGMEWLFKELVEKFKVDMNTAIVAAGYITVDSFQQGADLPNNELTQRNHILRDEITGEYFRWDGDLPKQVLAGSTPESTGGIGKGAWVSVGDASLRSDIETSGVTAKEIGTRAGRVIHITDFGVVDDYYLYSQSKVATSISNIFKINVNATLNPNPTDNSVAIQAALDSLLPSDVLSFSGMRHMGISKTVFVMQERVSIVGDNKDYVQILPNPNFNGSCLVRFGDGTQAYQKTSGIGYISAVPARGDDISSIEIDNSYNFEATDIKTQSGNCITREVAGIDLINGKHTRINGSQFHNNYCYGIIIRKHSSGLNIYDNAFDESAVSIISKGNILEMNSFGNEFGSAISNSYHPTPVSKIHIDLRNGAHGRIMINDVFSGGSETEYHIRWSNVKHMTIDGSFMSAKRFAIAGNRDTTSILNLSGIFGGNGTASTTNDASLGTVDPDTSPFCTDIHLAKAYLNPTNINKVSSDNKNPFAWIEGTARSLNKSNISLTTSSSASEYSVYTNGMLVSKGIQLANGFLHNSVSKVAEFTITARNIPERDTVYGSIPTPTATVGDAVVISYKTMPAEPSLVISGYVSSSNVVTFQISNLKGRSIQLPDTDIFVFLVRNGNYS